MKDDYATITPPHLYISLFAKAWENVLSLNLVVKGLLVLLRAAVDLSGISAFDCELTDC